MTAVILIAKPVSQMQLSPGSVATIPNVSWQEFEAILEELGERRSARIAYSNGTLEIMVPLPEHEVPKDQISDLVKTLLRALGKRYQAFGSTTFKKPGKAGIEPDACFYILNYQCMIGRQRLEPNDPPPDLAIETDVTSKTAIDAYEAIAVPEVWIYDYGKMTIYLLRDGKYVESEFSPNFPNIPITQLISATVERSWQVGSLQALEEFEVAIASLIPPMN
jgi:Uma2 family endonuclease